MKFHVRYHIPSTLHPDKAHGPFVDEIEADSDGAALRLARARFSDAVIEWIKPASISGYTFTPLDGGPRHG
jgi:hypothetical protein